MAGYRESTFLPTIKCSTCLIEIEISQMGDHVCQKPAPASASGPMMPSGEATPPPEAATSYDGPQNTRSGLDTKPARNLPPRVDTMAANRPFLRTDQLTPMSSDSRSISPMTPNSTRSPFAPPKTPVGLGSRGPPSPDATLSSNLDSPFPPFPTKKSELGHKPQGKSIGRGPNLMVEADPMYAPVSPRTATSGGLLERMNTIAPGPFDIRGRQGSVAGLSDSMQNMTLSSGFPDQYARRPSIASSVNSRSGSQAADDAEASRPKVPKTNGYGGFGPPPTDGSPEAPKTLDRSQTFPVKQQSPEPLVRRPTDISAPKRPSMDAANGLLNKTMSTRQSPPRERRPSRFGPDLTRAPPPRKASIAVPSNINLEAEFGTANPYHAPSESRSSNDSEYNSEDSKASSRSSPPSTSPERRPSTPNVNGARPSFPRLNSEPDPSSMKSESPIKQQFATPMKKPETSAQPPESPMDPAIQRGLSYVPPPRASARPQPPNRSHTAPPPSHSHPALLSAPRAPSPAPPRSPTPTQAPASTPAPAPAPAQTPKPGRSGASKGNCKACGLAIKGRSVSSADGRLTGRYHKECFVCTTCSEPFNSTTFYVLNDAPYCEQHYHRLNGSICAGCRRGIEGQYLEGERRQKFHPGCLRCMDCGMVLKRDYFEMNGRIYCERDAFRRTQQQGRFLGVGGPGGGLAPGGTNRMERRTTRLMMM
ncbi:hypothetical protein F5884DRAFT_857585 [Xylogone sp. PMI_703]|nr:hypothetical protein F5884DRAFT_857585 [Xylogone sp. PMI_703]